MKNRFRYSFFLFFLFTGYLAQAQENADRQQYYAGILKGNGVIVAADITTMAYADVQRIASYDFDNMRGYDSRQQVKLVRGPEIGLQSVQERVNSGAHIDNAVISKARSIAESHYGHPTRLVVDLHLGYKEPVKAKEKTTAFRIPKDNN